MLSQLVPIGVIRQLLRLIIIYKLHNNHLLIPRNVSYRYALGHCVNQLNHEGFYVRAHFLHDVACFCTYLTVGMSDRSMTAHSLHFHHDNLDLQNNWGCAFLCIVLWLARFASVVISMPMTNHLSVTFCSGFYTQHKNQSFRKDGTTTKPKPLKISRYKRLY